jgi:hypothetical protein
VTAGRRFRPRVSRSETGASLIIALTMVTVIGVALVGALGYSTSSLLTVNAISDQRNTSYAADAAMQTAIQVLRAHATAGAGAVGSACPSVTYPAVGGQPAVSVACQVVAQSPASSPGDTMPEYAILALGSSPAEAGIKLTTSGTVKIAGPIASSSPATGAGGVASVSAGTLDLGGYTLDAAGVCSGTVKVVVGTDKRCSTGVTYADPGYPSQPIPSPLPAPNPAPICTVAGGILQFTPGYYTNRALLAPSSYTAGGKTCRSGYLFFQPGVYYFDFGFDPAFPATVWTVGANQTIVGGQANGWDPDVAGSVPPAPGGGAAAACKTEANGGTAGVQFVFGGASHLSVTAAGSSVELCADPTPTGTHQQIAIYGEPTGAQPAPQTGDRPPAAAAATPAAGWTGLTPANNLLPVDPATTTIDSNVASSDVPAVVGGATASIDWSGYTAIPAGSVDVGYTLKVAHREIAAAAGNISSLKATITPASGSPCTYTASKNLSAALVTDSFTLSTACKQAIADGGYTITYAAKSASNKAFTAIVDGVDLVATYTAPAVRAESGCVLTDVASCSVVKVGTSSAKLYVWGTVYAPLAAVTANYVSTGAFEFRRGVIARTVANSGTPPADSTTGFCLGPGSPCVGPARVLRLTATIGGAVRLRALVVFVDTPALGSAVQVLSWNVVRG